MDSDFETGTEANILGEVRVVVPAAVEDLFRDTIGFGPKHIHWDVDVGQLELSQLVEVTDRRECLDRNISVMTLFNFT